MGKKGKLYVLVLVNLIAWGYVGYKVYKALQGDDDLELQKTSITYNKIEALDKEDSIKLALNYNDPFLKHSPVVKEHYNSTNQRVTNTQAVIKAQPKTVAASTMQIAPIDIKYLGLVSNKDKGTQTALLLINGKSTFAKLNDVIDGAKITQITADAIFTQKGKEKGVIKR